MLDLRRGTSFGFRHHRWWQFWKRGYGAAQVIAIESGVLHLRLFGSDGSYIAHLPIREAVVRRSAYQILESAPIPDELSALSEEGLTLWREHEQIGFAGVFSIPLGEAIDAVFYTVPSSDDPIVIESAYPVRNEGGNFRKVQVVVAGG
jgi:hypothetical protein